MRNVLTPTLPLLACSFIFASTLAVAQAGSRPPVHFDSQSAYFYSGAGIVASTSGQAIEMQPVYPAGVLGLSQQARYLLWAELEAGRLSVLENLGDKGFVLRKRIPISIGKQGMGKQVEGDQKTPLGVYRITNRLDDEGLDDYYGPGAYPIDYPNALDLLAGRTGHGIWLHGLPKTVTQRPFLDSDGCVVIDNQSLIDLAAEITPGHTQLVISRLPINWVTADELVPRRDSLATAIETWRRAWENRDNPAYLDFYAEDFSDLSRDRQSWSIYKSRVNAGKQFIDVELSDISMVTMPESPEIVDVRFYQRYASNDYRWQGWKHQLWRQEEGGWKIFYEGNG